MKVKEYCERYGFSESAVYDWLKKGLIEGADDSSGVWCIPEEARPRYVPAKKKNRDARDNAYDVIKALGTGRYIDAKVIWLLEVDYQDLIDTLLEMGLIESSRASFDGRWNTGLRLTNLGLRKYEDGKGSFVKYYRETVAGLTEGAIRALL